MKKFFIPIIFFFLPLLVFAQSCTAPFSGCPTSDQWSCISGTCQPAKCGDGVCNDCSNAFSPCFAETNNCPQDCGGTPSSPAPAPTDQFQDTDNGANFYVKGTTTGKQGGVTVTRTDSCQNSQLLNEYSLDSNNNIKTQLVVCNNGCSNGACVQSGTCSAVSPVSNSPAGVTPLVNNVGTSDHSVKNPSQSDAYVNIASHTAQIYSAQQTGTVGAFNCATKDWATYMDMIIMYSGSTCGSRVPTVDDYKAILALGYDGVDGYSPAGGQIVNGQRFYWAGILGKIGGGLQNQYINLMNQPKGCYYVFIYNTSSITGQYVLTWNQ